MIPPNPGRISSADLKSWASTVGVEELWRWKHPVVRCFSHISTAHGSSARIDLAFGNNLMLQYVSSIDYLAGGLSDHNPLLLTLAVRPGGERGTWRLSPGWLQHEQVAVQLGETTKNYWMSNVDEVGPPVVWDAFKAVIRGESISAIKTARVNENEEYENMQREERERAGEHAESPSRVSYESLLEVRLRLSLLV